MRQAQATSRKVVIDPQSDTVRTYLLAMIRGPSVGTLTATFESRANTSLYATKEGPEWVDDRYLDEVPVEFLLFILEAIKDRRPLNDTRPVTVEEATEAYILAVEADEAERELRKNPQLRFMLFRTGGGCDHRTTRRDNRAHY